MSVRLIAKDLYRLIGVAEKLNKEIQTASPANREELLDQLRKVKAERDHLRRALEGRKDKT
jgi:hypothetical protein